MMLEYAVAGFTAVPGGMNSGMNPMNLKITEFARGNNLSVRDGYAQTRGGLVETFRHATSGSGFRGAKTWRLNSGDWQVIVIGARIVIYSHETGVSYSFDGYLTDATSWCFLEQVDRWMVIQNGVDRPAVFQIDNAGVPQFYGSDAPTVCYVKATIMQYLHGRLFMVPVVSPNLTPDPALLDVVPNDEVGEEGRLVLCASDVRDNLNPEYVFRMSEHRTVAQGGNLTLPAEAGFIEGLGILRGASSGTGVGPLIVFGREVVCAFDVSIPRTQWLTTGIGQVLFSGAGTRSSRAIVTVNDDLVYLDAEQQIRFLRYDKAMLAGAGGALYNTSKSKEMTYWISQGDPEYLANASAAFVDNRFVWTLIGQSDGSYQAIGVLDTSPAYTMSSQEPPAYYGAWTGFRFLQTVDARVGKERSLFFYALAEDGAIVLLKYSDDAVTDPGSTPIQSSLVTRVFNFETPKIAIATDLKVPDYCELWISNIKRDTDIDIYYRVYGTSIWNLVASKSISVPSGPPQYRRALKFVLDQSASGCDTVLEKPDYVGERFEFLIRWSGFARIDMFRALARVVKEEDPDVCETDNEDGNVYTVDSFDPDFDYEVTL